VVIVSRIKSPQDKKNASLERDRRNTYGENAKIEPQEYSKEQAAKP
jgi:hypothetical protein